MKIFSELNEIERIEPTALALGNFDGMHLGHVALVKNAVTKAKEHGLKSAVFTFSNHPRNLISKKTGENINIKNILYPQEKNDIIFSLGVDYLFSIPFTEEIHSMSPTVFVQKLLIDKFNVKEVYCGFNYHYGKEASGNVDTLKAMGVKNGFKIDVMQPFMINGILVSSTLIRRLISEGKVEEASKFLGRNYQIAGEVFVGNKIGRTIGFPTSNIVIDNMMVQPSHGVYITLCDYNETSYEGVTNVGVRPTIGDEKKTVETYIFDFDKELYNKHIRVEFLKKIRDEIKFDNIKELAKRIAIDKKIAEEYHEQRRLQKEK